MTTVAVLFTGFALILALGCAACAWIAYDQAMQVTRYGSRLVALEHELATVDGKVHKLRQKVYSTDFQKRTNEIAPPYEATFAGGACENWVLAQTQGPLSTAATCDCAYCNAKREERQATRAKLVPKTTQERRDAIEKGKH